MLEVCVLRKKAFALHAAKRGTLPVSATLDTELKETLLQMLLFWQMD